MRFAGWIPLLLCFLSCGPSAVLYTDEVFRTAAPEIVKAWEGLGPFKDTRVTNLPTGAALSEIQAAQKAQPRPIALVGATLTATDRRELVLEFPRTRFLFLGANIGEESIGVGRLQAWEAVAQAVPPGATATVLFPSDASISDRIEFAAFWKHAGGGELTSWVWPEVGDLTQSKTVFQWVGPEADSRILALGPGTAVHGLPGTIRPPGVRGLTWKIREQGLADFLWGAVMTPKGVHFLPLETVPADRE